MTRPFYRRGPDHRAGSSVTFLDVRRRFQFRSVELGRWVTDVEKQRSAGLFYDALCDLMHILGGPEELVSLRGTLALQYGIGGRPGVSAHYTPATRSFALAKNAGPGSIAHEWFHAFDHYICTKLFAGVGPAAFASKVWLDKADAVEHPLNQLLQRCFQAVLLNEKGVEPSQLFQQSVRADKAAGIFYFSQPEELCARAFEAFVQDAACKNAFLVKGTRESKEAQLGLYPEGAQRERIGEAFAEYFRRLGAALRRQSAVTEGSNGSSLAVT
ncbi:CLCA_X family protein [Marinobacter fonticola]|uniref:CLCA_X family protein n=1 Tax=Marinobacter fonticola TaxID=2603215 RepID=UPI0011E7C3F2|nr:CLCA_X family protein [Marinobacter fonticola]